MFFVVVVFFFFFFLGGGGVVSFLVSLSVCIHDSSKRK